VPTENAFQIIQTNNATFAGVIATAGPDVQQAVETGEITVFAPSDAAVQALPAEVLSDPALAAAFVNGHIVSGSSDVAALEAAGQASTVGGQNLTFATGTVAGPDGTARAYTAPNQQATNGFVHGIDGVLFVPEVPVDTTSSSTTTIV
jgi:uncharacterized surface protein with fasciclin (FAS1) repeats